MARQSKLKPVMVIAVIAISVFLGYVILQYLKDKVVMEQPVANVTAPMEGGVAASASGSAVISKDEVRQIVKDYINEHPEEIIKSVEAMQRRSVEENQKNAQKKLESMLGEVENTTNTPFTGNPAGDVKIVEFFDYACHFCKDVNPTVAQLLKDDKNITVIYKEFPILGPISETASRFALAVYALDKSKYEEFHNKLMKTRINSESDILAVAEVLGIDTVKLQAEASKPEIMAAINKNRDLAKEIGVRGTPAFIVGGEMIPGAIDLPGLKAKIEEVRKKPAAAAPTPEVAPKTVPSSDATSGKEPDAAPNDVAEPNAPAAPVAPDAPAAPVPDTAEKPVAE